MLTYDRDDPSPPRKLLNYVLLMAARDGASVVRFEPYHRGSVDMWYCIDGMWYGLVPAPPDVWAGMKQAVKAASQTALHAPYEPWLPRVRWWQRKPEYTWTGGVLTHRFAEQATRWAVILDERRGREVLTLTGLNPTVPRGDADTLLREVSSRLDYQPERSA